MNNSLRVLLALWVLCTCLPLKASPIPAEKLFRSADISLPDISPNGDYVSYLARIGDQTYLTVENLATKQRQGILVLGDDEQIHGYDWLDEHTLLLSARLGKRNRLVIVAKDTSSTEDKWQNNVLPKDGYLVTALPNDKEHVLLALIVTQPSVNSVLYRFPIQALREGKLDETYKVPYLSEDLSFFAYSDELNKLISLQYNQEAETIFYSIRTLESDSEQQRYELKLEDWDFVPAGLLSDLKMAVLSNKESDTTSLYEF